MEYPQRKNNRLRNYDYSTGGAYFITICTQNRKQVFQMENACRERPVCRSVESPNKMLHYWICEIEHKFNVAVDQYVIMPDHIHMLIRTERHTGRSLQEILHWFKTMTTNDYINGVKAGVFPVFERKLWQKSYYDHVIRNQEDYNEVWDYIENNPRRWIEQE